MIIQIKKGRDSGPTLTCIRDDGSRMWSRVGRIVDQVLNATERFSR